MLPPCTVVVPTYGYAAWSTAVLQQAPNLSQVPILCSPLRIGTNLGSLPCSTAVAFLANPNVFEGSYPFCTRKVTVWTAATGVQFAFTVRALQSVFSHAQRLQAHNRIITSEGGNRSSPQVKGKPSPIVRTATSTVSS